MEPCLVSWEIRKERIRDKIRARIRSLEKEMNINITKDIKIKILEELNVNINNNEVPKKEKLPYSHFNKDEIRILEEFYANNKNPTPKDIEDLAIAIRDTKERVRKWISRRRLQEKKLLKK
uniref:Homeobox domain-containing protein n=1 Tax=Strongyloides venezuelensis TaxID=75913 RepID=A0A0K0G116_STRVS